MTERIKINIDPEELGKSFKTPEQIRSEWIDPLDRQIVQEVISGMFGDDLAKALKDSPRPQLSSNPNEQELDQSGLILKRREGFNFNDKLYIPFSLLRLWYEETFAVIPAQTLGGYITHVRLPLLMQKNLFKNFRNELNAPVTDPKIIEIFHGIEGKNKFDALNQMWTNISGLAIDEMGFKSSTTNQYAKKALQLLARIRSSPDFAFLYKHLTATGAFNQKQLEEK